MTSLDAFPDHLDRCQQCRDHPFALCQEGTALLRAAATAERVAEQHPEVAKSMTTPADAERAVDFEHCRQVLLRQMLPHALIGHPVAACLSRLGARHAAEWVHYETLPARARRRLKRTDVKFNHSPELFWLDVFWAVIPSIPQAFGYYDLAVAIFMRGPWWVAQRYNSCGYYSEFTSGGVVRRAQEMDFANIAQYLYNHRARLGRLLEALPESTELREFASYEPGGQWYEALNFAAARFGPSTRRQIQQWLEADWDECHSHE